MKNMYSKLILGFLCLLIMPTIQAQNSTEPVVLGQLQLIDKLDRPEDGYCIDIVGTGKQVRFDMPVIAHNCKPGLYADETISLQANGYIRFPAYDKCLTAAGLNSRALPGAAVIARDCGEQSSFLDAHLLQLFELKDDGRLVLKDSNLCLTVGHQSDSTFSKAHRWRALFLESCDRVEPILSSWNFNVLSQ